MGERCGVGDGGVVVVFSPENLISGVLISEDSAVVIACLWNGLLWCNS